MAVTIKSPREIELMREAGRILAKTHEELAKNLRPGMSTWDIDHMGEEIIRSYGCIPSFKNYNGYPASICVQFSLRQIRAITSIETISPLPILLIVLGLTSANSHNSFFIIFRSISILNNLL